MGIFGSSQNCSRWFFGLAWSSAGILFSLFALFSSYRIIIAILLPLSAYGTVPGTVITSRRKMYYSGRGSDSYGYNVIYTYSVGKNRYTSDVVNFSWIKADTKPYFAQSIISAYPVGRKITVYYQTSHPSFAVLDPRVPRASIIFVSILFFILFISVIGAALAIRAKHLSSEQHRN